MQMPIEENSYGKNSKAYYQFELDLLGIEYDEELSFKELKALLEDVLNQE